MKIYTDGSVIDSSESGAGFVIPDLKVFKSFSLGKGLSIFTCELFAILMALQTIINSTHLYYGILICVDSKSVLQTLKNWDNKVRCDIIYDIKHSIHYLFSKNVLVNFCWVPSHCGLYWNEVSDRLAKEGAIGLSKNVIKIDLHLSCHELLTSLDFAFNRKYEKTQTIISSCPRDLTKVLYRLRCNAWKTKYVKNISCTCTNPISVQHIFYECPILNTLFQEKGIDIKKCSSNISDFLHSSESIVLHVIRILMNSPIGSYL